MDRNINPLADCRLASQAWALHRGRVTWSPIPEIMKHFALVLMSWLGIASKGSHKWVGLWRDVVDTKETLLFCPFRHLATDKQVERLIFLCLYSNMEFPTISWTSCTYRIKKSYAKSNLIIIDIFHYAHSIWKQLKTIYSRWSPKNICSLIVRWKLMGFTDLFMTVLFLIVFWYPRRGPFLSHGPYTAMVSP